MIVDLPFSWTEPAMPPRTRTFRPVTFTDTITVDVPELSSREAPQVAEVTIEKFPRHRRRFLHDGTFFLRHVCAPGTNQEMSHAGFADVLSGRERSSFRFEDYDLPMSVIHSRDVANPTFETPVTVHDHVRSGNREAHEAASSRAGSSARRLVLVDGIVFRRCNEPRMKLTFPSSGALRGRQDHLLLDRSVADLEVVLTLPDYVDPRMADWFPEAGPQDVSVVVNDPSAFRQADVLGLDGRAVAAMLRSAMGHGSSPSQIERGIELLGLALPFSRLTSEENPEEAFRAMAACEQAGDRIDLAKAISRFLDEAGWVDRSFNRQRRGDMEALDALVL